MAVPDGKKDVRHVIGAALKGVMRFGGFIARN
jgi:hypothetical protein